MKYPEKVECRPDRIPNVRHPEKGMVAGQDSGCEPSGEGGIAAGQDSRCETSEEGNGGRDRILPWVG